MIRFASALRNSGRLGSFALVTALALTSAAAAAQDGPETHPAHIHAGTCAELGDVVVPLNDVTVPEGTASGPQTSAMVEVSEGNRADIPLQEIIDGGHAINVHLSAEEIGTYIACGDIGGILNERENGEGMELFVQLHELNGSGHVGVAWLGADGDATNVGITLIELGTMSGAPDETAQDASADGADAAAAVAVQIQDFAYDPPSVTVPVGGSVTWANADGVPHTATGLDREALQSGAIASGAEYTATFDTAGTIEYFCEFHPNMKGTVVVE